MLVTKHFMVPIDFLLPIFFNIYFVFSKRKKFIQVWNNLRVRK